MTNKLLASPKIESTDDMTSGGGLGAKIGTILVRKVAVGTDINAGRVDNESFLNAHVSITIDYDAGYSISGNYIYASKDKAINITTLEHQVDYAKNGDFDFDIQYQADDYKPFDNWSVSVADNNEVLDDILKLSVDYYEENEDRLHGLGEYFGFDYEQACQEVAYNMLGNLSPTNIRANVEPFTVDFVKSVDTKVRDAIALFLEKSS